ncbi:glycosyltransferase [Caenimonas sedimenti]|uniref:glycosyltransferase n=1 Tax=Caenimonas sedimenti TaxID=2596921 RepID=UPI0016443A81|nr:glycosyltransferase [Caenimonas sedimenti]
MSHPGRRVLVVSFSPLHRDPRVQRQLAALQGGFQLTTAGFTPPHPEAEGHVPLRRPAANVLHQAMQALRLKRGQFEAYYWGSAHIRHALRALEGPRYDLILANDLLSLPLGLRLARQSGCKLLLDAHEYEPGQHEDSWYFNTFFRDFWVHVAREYLPQADRMLTVSDGIAQQYASRFGVMPEVMTNAAPHALVAPGPVDPQRIRMVHHGSSSPSRKLEAMLDLMRGLDRRFSLDLMLMPDNARYLRRLKRLAAGLPNVRFRDPVPLADIVPALSGYDIGLYLLAPDTFNCRMALPNKLFEFVQARLAIAIWPSPEMARIVQRHDLGLVGSDFSVGGLAAQLNAITADELRAFKRNADRAAPELSADRNQQRLRAIVEELLGG